MRRQFVSSLLVVVLALNVPLISPNCPSLLLAQEPSGSGLPLKEKMIKFPAQSLIEAQTASQGSLRGRIQEMNDESFVLELASANRIETMAVEYQEVKKVGLITDLKMESIELTSAEKVLQVPPGSAIEVQLQSKEKIRGRLGSLDKEGFTVQVVKDGKVQNQAVSYQELKSIKLKSGEKISPFWYALAGGGAAVGALFILALAMAGD